LESPLELEKEPHEHSESTFSGTLLDSKTSYLDDLLNEKLERAFHKQTSQVILHDIAKIASEYDPIDLAHAVTRLPPYARVVVYDNLPDLNAKIIFMINTGNSTRAIIFRQISDNEIQQLIENMPLDEVVSFFDDMSDRRFKRVLDLLDSKRAHRIKELQKHGRRSAGRLMTNEFFLFPMNTTIGEVAEQIRDNPGVDLTREIFVSNDSGELIGSVPARNLIVNQPFIPIRQVMGPILHKVTTEVSRDEVVELVDRYKIPALPVVDKEDRLLGVITYEDVVEAMEDIADETIASIAGTAEDVTEHEPILKRFLWRAPWLLVTLLAGLINATAMTHFSDRLWFAVVPFFIPLITGMSGNVGIQCSTIIVRGMSMGELSHGTRREAIFQEFGIGLLIGTLFGVSCGLLIYFANFFNLYLIGSNPVVVAMTVCFGVLGACLTATLLGAISPFFFMRFRIDPAVASGPIVTAFNDVLSTLIFFLVARMTYTLLA
jgi:magnesium transporter